MLKALNQGNLAKSAARGFTSLTREPLFKVTVRHAKWANTTMQMWLALAKFVPQELIQMSRLPRGGSLLPPIAKFVESESECN